MTSCQKLLILISVQSQEEIQRPELLLVIASLHRSDIIHVNMFAVQFFNIQPCHLFLKPCSHHRAASA